MESSSSLAYTIYNTTKKVAFVEMIINEEKCLKYSEAGNCESRKEEKTKNIDLVSFHPSKLKLGPNQKRVVRVSLKGEMPQKKLIFRVYPDNKALSATKYSKVKKSDKIQIKIGVKAVHKVMLALFEKDMREFLRIFSFFYSLYLNP